MAKIGSNVIADSVSKLEQSLGNLKEEAKNLGGRIIGEGELVAEQPLYPIHDYDQAVSPGLTRGSRLEPGEMQKLKDAGFKGFVDLRAEAPGADLSKSNETAAEKGLSKLGTALAKTGLIKPTVNDVAAAKAVGVNAVQIPIVDNTAPTTGQMVTFLNFATKKENRPVYVHCEAGQGRTGVAVAAYRMAVQGWSADEALADYHSHTSGLDTQAQFIKQFGAQLKEGKIPGYPLSPPEPSVRPSVTAPASALKPAAPSWMGKPGGAVRPAKDGMDPPRQASNRNVMLGQPSPGMFQSLEAKAAGVLQEAKAQAGAEMRDLEGKADGALNMIKGVPQEVDAELARIHAFFHGRTSPKEILAVAEKMPDAKLKGMSAPQRAELANLLAAPTFEDSLPMFGADRDALSKQFVRVLTSGCQNPSQKPLSPADAGQVDAVLSRMRWSSSQINGRMSGPAKADLAALTNRPITRGDWSGFQSYTDAATLTKQSPGTLIQPLIDGGLVPEGGRPAPPALTVPPGTKMKVEDSNGAFPQIFKAIDSAKAGEPVYVTEFAVQSDDTGHQLAQHLMDAKARGCDVRLMYDPKGSEASNGLPTDPSFYDSMRAKGIPVMPFPSGAVDDHLSHRKIIIAGQTGFIGGMNIGDEYSAIWHDCHSKVTGPGVGDLMQLFTSQWNGALGTNLHRAQPQDRDALVKSLGNPGLFKNDFASTYAKTLSPVPGAPTGDQSARIVGHVGNKDENMKLTYLRGIATAKDRVYVKAPYTSDPDVFKALIAAKQAGVPHVVLMVPANNDVSQEKDAIRGWYPDLLKAGVEVYEFKGRSMDHGKDAVFDNVSTIGSSNLDARSLENNDEANEWTSDPATANKVAQDLFQKDMNPSRSDRVTPKTLASYSEVDKIRYEIARSSTFASLI